MNKKLENKNYSFLELLEKVGIKIPIIQRDYAQGREEEKTVRERFVNSLFDAVSKNEPLYLDFIYGTIKDNYLIPLDGQQRLTTLFLLHYYLALTLKEKNRLSEIKEKLRKFTYETRVSSREFCKLLVENEVKLLDDKLPISKIIKNQTWFFSEWENDPTIKSMLTMLDTIQEKFKDCDNCFNNLNNITFSFLDLEEFQLTDELYIKMNARGKPLSEFENFKSHFVECIDKTNLPNKENIKAKLDNEWFDIFWNLEKKNLIKIDLEIKDENEKEQEKRRKLESIENKYLNFFKNITAFFSKDFKEVDINKFVYNKYHINIIVQVLELLKNYKKYQQIINEIRDNINIFEDFIGMDSSKKEKEYVKRMRFYALILYFINNDFNAKEFKQWMRVSLNIIHNTLYNTLKEFKRDRILLHKLIKLLGTNFYYKLSKSNISDIKQFKEEKLKAELISKNPKWEDEFIKAEKHWYLDGQIGFLINYSNKIIGNFIIYRDKFIKLWNFTKNNENKSIKKNETLIHRALLSFTDYTKLTQHGDKYTFCTFGTGLREKSENWRKVFGSNIFKEFLDSIKTIDNINIKLKKLINNNHFKCDDWKSYIINPNKDWSVLDETKHYQIYKKNNIIYLNRGNVEVTSWQWRKFYDLYNYYLYRLLRYDINIIENTSFDRIEPLADIEYPCFYIDGYNIQNHHFALDIFFEPKTNKFLIRFFDRKKKDISQNLLEFLQRNKFEKDKYKKIREYGYWNDKYKLCEMKELIKFLETFLKEIVNHT